MLISRGHALGCQRQKGHVMLNWGKGRYRTRMADGADDLAAAQALRYRAFIAGTGARPRPGGRDTDHFDALCHHVLIEEARTDRLVATFRMMPLMSGAEIGRCCSAQYYELDALRAYAGRMVEMGRFCIEPGV
ncbi:MAG: GNAT family N-acetyltransferase, partial [Silicimonas sp.]|nr:GNAT family N-acetyltransferase [Silicimonas sp.]